MLDLDLVLAILHHFLVFALFGVLFSEFVVVRRGMDAAAAARVVAIDAWYGVLAVLILIVGFSRAIFAAKGWEYYAHNVFFWAKIGTFAAIGLLSVPPTLTFLKWRRAGASPTDEVVHLLIEPVRAGPAGKLPHEPGGGSPLSFAPSSAPRAAPPPPR